MIKLVQGNYCEVIAKLDLDNYVKIENYETMLRYRNQSSLFGKRPVLVSTNADLQKYDFADFNNDILIVLDKVDKRAKLYKHCKKNKAYYEFDYHEDITHLPPQYQAILKTVEDQNVFNNVVRQLNLLEELNDEKFYAVLGNVGDFNIFKTIDFLIDNNPKKFFMGYKNLIEQGESPFKVMAIIRNRLEDMLILKSYENHDINTAQQLSGLNYYFIKNNVHRVKKQSINTLKNQYKQVVNTQYRIISGELEEGLAINELLTNLFVIK